MGADDRRSAAVLEELAIRYRLVRVERPGVALADEERGFLREYVEQVIDSMAVFDGQGEARDLSDLAQRAAHHMRARHGELSDAAIASAANCICFDWK